MDQVVGACGQVGPIAFQPDLGARRCADLQRVVHQLGKSRVYWQSTVRSELSTMIAMDNDHLLKYMVRVQGYISFHHH